MSLSSYQKVKAWRKNTKLCLFEAFGSRCVCCGLVDDPIVYDFHHIDPTKKETNLALNRSWARLCLEAEKCVMVCSHCHRKIHAFMIDLPEDVQRFDQMLVTSFKKDLPARPNGEVTSR